MEPSSDRFIRAVQTLWEMRGGSRLSARRISALADAPVSSIYHHFGSLEQLLVISQQASLARAKAWLDDVLGQFNGMLPIMDAFPGFFSDIVDEWTSACRDLAFAWRECQLLAEGNVLFRPLSAEWDRLWSHFWHEVGKCFALGAGTLVAYRVFENESFLHMIRWRRLIDRASLDEMSRVLGSWLYRRPVPTTPWRDFARIEALRSMPDLPQRDETAARIVSAAASLISDCGVAQLTHRAVADRAGLTLGSVSHKFTTKSALLEAGFEGLYVANLSRMRSGEASLTSPTREAVLAALSGMVLHGTTVRGSDELFLAVARDPSLSQFGLQLRYLRGRTSQGSLQALVGEARVVTHAEAALFSSFTTSQIRCFSGSTSPRAVSRMNDETSNLMELLTPNSSDALNFLSAAGGFQP